MSPGFQRRLTGLSHAHSDVTLLIYNEKEYSRQLITHPSLLESHTGIVRDLANPWGTSSGWLHTCSSHPHSSAMKSPITHQTAQARSLGFLFSPPLSHQHPSMEGFCQSHLLNILQASPCFPIPTSNLGESHHHILPGVPSSPNRTCCIYASFSTLSARNSSDQHNYYLNPLMLSTL